MLSFKYFFYLKNMKYSDDRMEAVQLSGVWAGF